MKTNSCRLQAFLLLAVVFGSTLLAKAQSEQTSHFTRPVPEGGGPTRIHVNMVMLDIDEIDSAKQSFTVNLFIVLQWQDPRLAHPGPSAIFHNLHDIWHPNPIFVNRQRLWHSFPNQVKVDMNGNGILMQRVWGQFSQPLNVRNFPFDSQELEVRIASATDSETEVEFVQSPTLSSGLADQFSLPDWRVLSWELKMDPYRVLGIGDESRASAALAIQVKRYASVYAVKVLLPLVLIVMMSWIVFWIDPQQAGTQIGVATTSMLTLIAYRFMVGGNLPAVPYLTRMDAFILGSTVLVFAALIQAVYTSSITSQGKQEQMSSLDRLCRVLFPLLFLALLAWAFWLF